MNKFLALAVAFAVAIAIACSGGGYEAPSGSIIQNTVMHQGSLGQPTDLGGKTGEACASATVGIISGGDAGVKAAAAAGGITTVKAVDYRTDNLLGSVLSNTCTIVYGD